MSCYRRRSGRRETGDRRRSPVLDPRSPLFCVRDDRGAAALEGILVFALLAGVFFASLLISNWGTSLQFGQMGARLLSFDAGDVELARLGKPSRSPTQQFGSTSWDTLSHIDPVTSGWLGGMFVLSNDFYSGSVSDTTQGRLPGQTRSLLSYGPATMSYFTHDWSAAANPWVNTESIVQLQFLNIAYHVGRYRMTPSGLDSTNATEIPYTTPVLETVFGRLGIR